MRKGRCAVKIHSIGICHWFACVQRVTPDAMFVVILHEMPTRDSFKRAMDDAKALRGWWKRRPR